MQDKEYWIERAIERENQSQIVANSQVKNLIQYYENSKKSIKDSINHIIKTYSVKNKLDSETANLYLNRTDTDAYRKKIEHIIKTTSDDQIRSELIAIYNAPAYKGRINALNALKLEIEASIKQLKAYELSNSDIFYQDIVNRSYFKASYDIQKGMGIASYVQAIPDDTMNQLLSEKWSGKNYSQRIWKNADVLSSELKKILNESITKGDSIQKMSKEIDDRFEVGKFNATRLVRTETNYFSNQGELQSYLEAGIDQYRFIATLDIRTSEICREHDMKIYDIKKAVPGKNYPPLHPFCRSTTIMYDPEEADIGLRAARDSNGKSIKVDSNMTYNEWFNKYVKNDKTGSKNYEMFKNKYSDKKQFQTMQNHYLYDAPKSLKEFQEMKYSDVEHKINISKMNILGKTNENSTNLEYNISKALSHSIKTQKETLLVLDAKTGKPVFKQLFGSKNGVKFDNELTEKLVASKKGSLILLHNHPMSSSFSAADIAAAFKYNSVKNMIVIGQNRTVYSASFDNINSFDLDNVKMYANHFKNITNSKYLKKNTKNDNYTNLLWQANSHEIMNKLSNKLNFEYRRDKSGRNKS